MTSKVYKIKGPGHKDRANPPFCFHCRSHCGIAIVAPTLSTLVFNRLSALGTLCGTEGNYGKY